MLLFSVGKGWSVARGMDELTISSSSIDAEENTFRKKNVNFLQKNCPDRVAIDPGSDSRGVDYRCTWLRPLRLAR